MRFEFAAGGAHQGLHPFDPGKSQGLAPSGNHFRSIRMKARFPARDRHGQRVLEQSVDRIEHQGEFPIGLRPPSFCHRFRSGEHATELAREHLKQAIPSVAPLFSAPIGQLQGFSWATFRHLRQPVRIRLALLPQPSCQFCKRYFLETYALRA